jgi:hypothetical protein
MQTSGAKASFGLSAVGTLERPWESGTITVGLSITDIPIPQANVPFSASLFLQDDGDEATLDTNDFSTTTDSDSAVAANLTTALSGSNNDLVFTAIATGVSGNQLSVAYSAPVASSYTTSVSVTDDLAILVTLAAKARQIITGTLNDGSGSVTFPTMLVSGTALSRPYYVDNIFSPAYTLQWDGAYWVANKISGGGTWKSASDVATPDLATGWTPTSPSTGTPTVTAAVTSAYQVKAAIDGDIEAQDLVTVANAGGNDGTGAVSTMVATGLSNGLDANGWTGAAFDFNGNAFPNIDAVYGLLVYCESGLIGFSNTTGTTIILPQGAFAQIAINPSAAETPSDGLLQFKDVFTFTANTDNTRIFVSVLAKA